MKWLICLGVLSALFFSSTFVINHWLNINGGHWYWTASLRYYYTLAILSILILLTQGTKKYVECFRCFLKYWRFWLIAGGIGYATFYLLLCFSASYAPGWVIATTWQFTILASPVVLLMFGEKVPLLGILNLIFIFIGICLVNLNLHADINSNLLRSVIPVLIASFCYPFGNTLCKFAVEGRYKQYSVNEYPITKNVLSQVFLMCLGALPVLVLVGLWIRPMYPTINQIKSVFIIAILTGVIATSVFYYARQKAANALAISVVDATQSMEVPFAFLIGFFIFNEKDISSVGIIGLVIVVFGIIMFSFKDSFKRN